MSINRNYELFCAVCVYSLLSKKPLKKKLQFVMPWGWSC